MQEGVVQLFRDPEGGSASWILGAMGPLQFDVMKHRLATEYGVELKLSHRSPTRSPAGPRQEFDPEDFRYSERIRCRTRSGRPLGVARARAAGTLDRLLERKESLVLSETPDPSLFESAS